MTWKSAELVAIEEQVASLWSEKDTAESKSFKEHVVPLLHLSVGKTFVNEDGAKLEAYPSFGSSGEKWRAFRKLIHVLDSGDTAFLIFKECRIDPLRGGGIKINWVPLSPASIRYATAKSFLEDWYECDPGEYEAALRDTLEQIKNPVNLLARLRGDK